MEPDQAQEISERDQLWASLRSLRAEIEKLAAGGFEGTILQQNLVVLVSRIVVAELDFQTRMAGSDGA
jgi:hypothetical protein